MRDPQLSQQNAQIWAHEKQNYWIFQVNPWTRFPNQAGSRRAKELYGSSASTLNG